MASQIKANTITDVAGTGAPDFPNGLTQNAGVANELVLQNLSGVGSGPNITVFRFSNTLINTGTAITYADDATNGMTATINEDGLYYGMLIAAHSNANTNVGITINGSTTTAIASQTNTAILTSTYSIQNQPPHCSFLRKLASGDIIRPQGDNNTNVSSSLGRFILIQICKM